MELKSKARNPRGAEFGVGHPNPKKTKLIIFNPKKRDPKKQPTFIGRELEDITIMLRISRISALAFR